MYNFVHTKNNPNKGKVQKNKKRKKKKINSKKVTKLTCTHKKLLLYLWDQDLNINSWY